MNKKVIVGIIALVIVIGGAYAIFHKSSSTSMPTSSANNSSSASAPAVNNAVLIRPARVLASIWLIRAAKRFISIMLILPGSVTAADHVSRRGQRTSTRVRLLACRLASAPLRVAITAKSNTPITVSRFTTS
jgi:hypothetical protein